MTEWLDLMLEEIRRKNAEDVEATAETEQRDREKKSESPAIKAAAGVPSTSQSPTLRAPTGARKKV